MKAVMGYVSFALVAYTAFLVSTFPADRAYAMLERHMPPGVQLYGVNGSVWHGQAQVAQVGRYRLAPFTWQYRPAGLLSGRLDVKVSFDSGPGHAAAVVGLYRDGDVHLADVDVGLPAGELVHLFRLPIIQLAGNVTARLDSLAVESHRLDALDGTLTWDKARVLKPSDFVLGGLEARFETKDRVIRGILRDKGGPLQVQGIVTLKPDGTYQVNADLENRDPGQPQLTRFLHGLGRPGPGGKVTVNYSGKMPVIPVGL